MLIDRRGLFSGCRVYSALAPAYQSRAVARERAVRDAFRERAEEDYSDSFWLADFVFSNRPVPISVPPAIRHAMWGKSSLRSGGSGVVRRKPVAATFAITAGKILRSRRRADVTHRRA